MATIWGLGVAMERLVSIDRNLTVDGGADSAFVSVEVVDGSVRDVPNFEHGPWFGQAPFLITEERVHVRPPVIIPTLVLPVPLKMNERVPMDSVSRFQVLDKAKGVTIIHDTNIFGKFQPWRESLMASCSLNFTRR